MSSHWPMLEGIAYGGDYNPEQWPRQVWKEDARLMKEAGVNFVSVGIFSWALLEPAEGVFDFGWLDEVLDLMHHHGIAVDLGTPTAAPPAWFYAAHPDSRVVRRDGTVLSHGSRGMVSPSSPAYQQAIVRISDALARRYAHHPAVVMWHIHNEYGPPAGEDYSHHATRAFRIWLREKYSTLENLNGAWGTAFWGQHYEAWDHIIAPAKSAGVVNPAQRLDFTRFTDHQMRRCFLAEREAIRAQASQPVTTNFMANQHWGCDLWKWAEEVDVVSDDHYLVAADAAAEIHLAMAADLTRSVAAGQPWFLLEHSTSAVNWQPRNTAKRPGEMARNSLAHLARGADGIGFFQWRASRSGAEKFHSSMLPHAGTDTRVWREVVELGGHIASLGELKGSRVRADVAMIWDFESFWAQDLQWGPSVDLDHKERVRAYYERLWRDGLTVDFALPSHDLSRYPLVIVPAQYLLSQEDAENLTSYVAEGGTLVVSYFSAVVDEQDAVHEGGFGAPLRKALGIRVEEFLPLLDGQEEEIRWNDSATSISDLWQEDLQTLSAETTATFTGGPGAGGPAVTRNRHGRGTAWYVATRLDAAGTRWLMDSAYADAGVELPKRPERLEVVVRQSADADYLIAINHGGSPAGLAAEGHELLTGTDVHGRLEVGPGRAAVVRTYQQNNQ